MEKQEKEKILNWLRSADALVINTGAGMGVDSGLPDFRGTGGQWGKVSDETGLTAMDVSNPKFLEENPQYVWKMFAKRMLSYRDTVPHNGFSILLNWIKLFNLDYFSITSNVDEQFLKAGFDKLKYREVHGSFFYMQCNKPCTKEIWELDVNLETIFEDIEAEKYPRCPNCGHYSRPNVYMFRDYSYIPTRNEEQEVRFQNFLTQNKNKQLLVIEIGSGPHVQSIRKKTRMLGIKYDANIIRIDPKNFKIKEPHIGIEMGALAALSEIDEFIKKEDNSQND